MSAARRPGLLLRLPHWLRSRLQHVADGLRRFIRPSLARRLLLTLLGALAACFAVLVLRDWLRVQLDPQEMLALVGRANAVVHGLPQQAADLDAGGIGEVEPAAIVIARAEWATLRWARRQAGLTLPDVEVHLERLARPDQPGGAARSVMASSGRARELADALAQSPELRHLPPAETPPVVGEIRLPATVAADAPGYWYSQQAVGLWRLTLFEPIPAPPLLLGLLAGELVVPFLIALPLLMLPLVWSVRRGLQPLDHLTEAVRRRRPDADQPLGLNLRQAELQPLEQALDALAARTRQALARERRFVHDAAHELRTPLAVIATRAHALAHETDPAARAGQLAAIEHAVERTTHLGQQLLTLASLDEAGAAPPAGADRVIDLVAFVRRTLADAMPRAEARQMELALDSPETLPAAADPHALQSVLENLVGNAIRHGRDGMTIELTLQPRPLDAATGDTAGGWSLTVADDGPGIPAEERERIFDRFQRGSASRLRTSHGAGLGLAIVRAAVTRLGGRLHIEDGLQGKGVAFVVQVDAEVSGRAAASA